MLCFECSSHLSSTQPYEVGTVGMIVPILGKKKVILSSTPSVLGLARVGGGIWTIFPPPCLSTVSPTCHEAMRYTGKGTYSEARRPRFKCQLSCLLPVLPWASHLPSLCLSFLNCKIEIIFALSTQSKCGNYTLQTLKSLEMWIVIMTHCFFAY